MSQRAYAGLSLGLAALVLGAPPAAAQTAGAAPEPEGRIRVVGRAQAETPPDFAEVGIGVEARGPTPAAALDAASGTARRVIAMAREVGVAEADIATSSVTLQPATRTVRGPDGVREQPDGYAAGNRVRIRLADMGRLGDLMRRALDAGANRIHSVGFGRRDPAAAEAAVQAAAMRDARAQGERLAEAAGVRLGAAVTISAPPRSEAARPFALAARPAPPAPRRASVPLAAGTIETGAEVEAVFAITP